MSLPIGEREKGSEMQGKSQKAEISNTSGAPGCASHKSIARQYRMLASKSGDSDDASDLREFAAMHERAALASAREVQP